MTIPAATKNTMLSGLTIDGASLHSGFPGSIGANEISGAQQAVVFGSASGGVRTLTSAVTFAGLPVCTVKWVGFKSGASFLACAPNGGAVPKNFMAVPSSDMVYSVSHGYPDGQKVVFFNGTPPGGLTEGQTYFVRDSATDSFKVAETDGGAAINLTSSASFGCVVSAITEAAYTVAGGSHQLSAASAVIPD